MRANDILSLNAGSSSLKFQLFRPTAPPSTDDPTVLASGSIKLSSSGGAKLSIVPGPGSESGQETTQELAQDASDITSPDLLKELLSNLAKAVGKGYDAEESVGIVCHRIVHGGEEEEPIVLWKGHEKALERIDALAAFAPLHNFAALKVVHNALTLLPSSHSHLYFDTSFHRTLPPAAQTYPLPPSPSPALPGNLHLRRYGFHGLSYSFILTSISSHLITLPSHTTLIVAHLGSGASVCAIKNGESIDTSMGLTPLEGMPGSTRSGTVDPSLGYHLSPLPRTGEQPDGKETFAPLVRAKNGQTPEEGDEECHLMSRAEYFLNKKAGYGALAGTTDFGEITARIQSARERDPKENNWTEEEKKAKLAFDVFEDRLVGFIGSYYLKLSSRPSPQPVDALVFSGGIGEQSSFLRESLARKLEGTPMGVRGGFDPDRWKSELEGKGPVYDLGGSANESENTHGVGVRWLACETDEELQMARLAIAHDRSGDSERS